MTAAVSLGFNKSSTTRTAPPVRPGERPDRGHRNTFQLSKENGDTSKAPQHSHGCRLQDISPGRHRYTGITHSDAPRSNSLFLLSPYLLFERQSRTLRHYGNQQEVFTFLSKRCYWKLNATHSKFKIKTQLWSDLLIKTCVRKHSSNTIFQLATSLLQVLFLHSLFHTALKMLSLTLPKKKPVS